MAGGNAPVSALSIRAAVAVSPCKDSSGDGGSDCFDLAKSMNQLSIMPGSGIDSDGSSENAVAHLSHLSRGKNIVADVVVAAGQNDEAWCSSCLGHAGFDYACGGVKQIFRVPLRATFMQALKSTGINDPVFIDVAFKGSFHVHIQFDSKLPICLEGGSNFADIAGDVCPSYELAEESAIKKAFDHLGKMHNVVLVDISSRKKSSLIRNARECYSNVIDGLRIVGNILEKWHECLNKLFQVEKLAHPKMKYDSDMEKQFVNPLLQFMQAIKADAMSHIRSSDAKLKHLTARKDQYVEESRSQPLFCRKASIIKAVHGELDVLNLLLHWLGLHECQYHAAAVDGSLFLGSVMLTFPEGQNFAPPGDMAIEADTDRSTEVEAVNCAAREAIFYIEKVFNVRVVGYNHDETVAAEHDMVLISLLNKEVLFLGATMMKLWEGMINNIDEVAVEIKNSADVLVPVAGNEDGLGFVNNMVTQFELAAEKCSELFRRSAARFATLN